MLLTMKKMNTRSSTYQAVRWVFTSCNG